MIGTNIRRVDYIVLLLQFITEEIWLSRFPRHDAAVSIKDGRKISVWRCKLVNFLHGNPEDGVFRKEAIVFTTGQPGPYMPGTPANPILAYLKDVWRAYRWSALRNSADGVKYAFAWKDGPIREWTWTLFGKTRKAKVGWQMENGFNVPVFSL